MKLLLPTFFFLCLGVSTGVAHEIGQSHEHTNAPLARPLRFQPENRGPIKAPEQMQEKLPVSGQHFWKFVAVTNAMPVPAEALPFVKGAHGTLIVDAERDTVYWGLKSVGWIGFSNQLRNSWVVKGDEQFTHNNLHGADILHRKGRLPLVAAADNEGHKVYLTDTTFLNPQLLMAPENGPYETNKTYRPTDVAFVDSTELFITDGYARGYFMPAMTDPPGYEGRFFGGHKMSQTPHGITYDARDKTLLVSARPEGQVQRWSVAKEKYLAIDSLPAGTLLCDVDLWGNYGLAACLENPNKAPGPLMVLNLKKKTIASIIKPKKDLGYDFADHMHDAVWYFHKNGKHTDVYLIFTAWNPGGIGALKLVNVPE